MNKKNLFLNVLILIILTISAFSSLVFATELNPEDYFKDFTGLYLVDDEIVLSDTEKIKVKVEVYGNKDIKKISVNFYSFEDNETFNADMEGIIGTSDTYLIIPNTVKPGIRYTMMYVNVTSADGKTINYATTSGGSGYMNTFGRKYLTVKKQENNNITLKALEFEKSEIDFDKEKTLAVKKLEIEGNATYGLVSVCFKNDYGSIFGPGAIYTSYSGIFNLNLDNSAPPAPRPVKGTTYYLTDIYILSEDCSKILKHYVTPKGSIAKDLTDVEIFNTNYSLKILDNEAEIDTNRGTAVLEETENSSFKLNNIEFKNGSQNYDAKLNEKIEMKLDYESKSKIKSIMISFYNNKAEEMMPVFLKSINKNPYFIVPFNVKPGKYEMNYAIFEMEDGSTYHYRKSIETTDIKHFDFNSNLEISSETTTNEEKILEFLNDSNKAESIVNAIKSIDENTVITIDANSDSIIKKEVFEEIKGRNVTLRIICGNIEWVINGKDVEIIKDIDVKVYLSKIGEEDKSPLEGDSKGYIMNFASNGYLPGKTLIRVKMNSITDENLSQKKYNAYYYNETSKTFDKVAVNKIVSDDGYFEFYINHNSSYVISENEVDSKYVSDKTEDLELNSNEEVAKDESNLIENVTTNIENIENKDSNNNILIVIIAVLVLIIIVLIMKNSISKKDK